MAIEEQFYLVFPVALVGLWWSAGRRLAQLAGALGALTVCGVALQAVLARQGGTNRAYMGTDARMYQLLIGATVAVVLWRYPLPAWSTRLAGWFSFLALAGLVASGSWLVDLAPSSRGILAACCAALVLVALEAARLGRAARMLSVRPLRWLGQISYGTYLWHWPAIVLIEVVADVDPLAMAAWSAVIGTALAAVSHELVERDIRYSRVLDRAPVATIAIGVMVAVVGGTFVGPRLLELARRPAISARSTMGLSEMTGAGSDDRPVPVLDLCAGQARPAPV